jgi:DNA polymerase-3 subunit epsilon
MSGAELVIHNAAFDVAFLDMELKRLKRKQTIRDVCAINDTLLLARKLHPGQRNSLDALCKRYDVDNSNREFHGALLDAHLLLDVFLAMTGGQAKLILDEVRPAHETSNATVKTGWTRPPGQLAVLGATESERVAHEKVLATLDKASGGKTIWRKLS